MLIINNNSNTGGGISFLNSNPTLYNVTLSGNSAISNGGGIYSTYNSYPNLVNCILWNNIPQEIYSSQDTITVIYSDIQGGWEGEGNIDSDPLFVDITNEDYHLTENSPCIDAGDPNSPYDPDGTIADMGAYYYDQSNSYSGPVWHVSTTGSDSTGTGSFENPFASIQHGINTAVDSDTVLVQPGTYFENIHFDGKGILLTSFYYLSQDTTYISDTVIDGNGDNHVVTFTAEEDSTSILSGFTITNGFSVKGGGIYCDDSSPKLTNLIICENNISGGSWNYGAGIYLNRSSPMLYNVTINNNISSGNTRNYGGGIFCEYSSPRLFNVTIKNNEVSGGSWNYGGGMKCFIDSNPYLCNVTIENNSAFGGSWNYGGGLCLYYCSAELNNVVVVNNSVWGDENNNGAGIFCHSSSPIINNTTIANNNVENGALYTTGGLYVDGDSQAIATNCIIWNNTPVEIYCDTNQIITYSDILCGWVGNGNISIDPLFIDLQNGDYHLSQNSPCIDAGDPNSPFDPDGTIADMGAFYFDQNTLIEESEIKTVGYLISNYPNPFNPSTTISFLIQNDSRVELSIYNIKGQKVKQLLYDQLSEGQHSVVWDGKDDDNNKPIGSGIYFYKLDINGKTEAVKKCLLLK
ncbi:MAG: T9SS type A sorting domain-containing protein [Candidatus Cloacimonetes bacterium]|nr:T9SS type A sorting domain-containing protein [Candidatus Cloacimonadota bacterium]